MKTDRTATVCLLIAASLTGCADYRSGKHWNSNDDSGWQQETHTKWVSKTCDTPATVSTQGAGEGYVHSLFLIPLGLGGSALSSDETKLYVVADGLNGHCDRATLAVSVNGQLRNDTQISACGVTNDCCAVSLPIDRQDMESMRVDINIPGAQCSYKPLKLESSRHFCIRPTRFGGSEGCGY